MAFTLATLRIEADLVPEDATAHEFVDALIKKYGERES
jgi:hypothetical protein